MKRKKTGLKSLDGIDLAIAIKNSGQEGVNIECSYKGDLRYVVDADYGCSSRCYLKDVGSGFSVLKSECFPTKKGWKEIKALKKRCKQLTSFKNKKTKIYNQEKFVDVTLES